MKTLEDRERELDEMETLSIANNDDSQRVDIPLLGDGYGTPTHSLGGLHPPHQGCMLFSSVIRNMLTPGVNKRGIPELAYTHDVDAQCISPYSTSLTEVL